MGLKTIVGSLSKISGWFLVLQKSINVCSNVFVLCFRFVLSFCVFALCFRFMFSFYIFAFGFRFKNTPLGGLTSADQNT